MLSDIINNIETEIYPRLAPYKDSLVTIGIGASVLVCLRYYLSSRYGRCKNRVSMSGKTCIITGATSGIGQAVAKELAHRKANVIIACRNVQKGSRTALMIRNSVPYPVNLSVYHLDLASMESIRNFAFEINSNSIDVDVLINNAGLFGAPYTLSADGKELHFAVNYLGHFLLTHLLLPQMKNKKDARIINVSSSLYKRLKIPDFEHTEVEKDYSASMAYARSKLANIMFTLELSKRLPKGITVNVMHPGIVFTDLARYHIKNNIFLKYLYQLFGTLFLRSADDGAETIIHMATDPQLQGVSGEYFGDCDIEDLQPHAKDVKVAERLFALSEEYCGVIRTPLTTSPASRLNDSKAEAKE